MSDVSRQWPRVKEIFDEALARPADRRAAFVRDECGDDVALADEVLSLLAAHAAAGSFAEQPAIERVAALDASTTAGRAPAMATGFELGTYRILGPLDAGGMGEVYRALDTRLHREVAVKVLPAALSDDPDRVARLEREARLLAALNHPLHRHHPRPRNHRRPARHRDGNGRRPYPGRSSFQRTVAARRGTRTRAPDRRGAGGRAREGDHPPRSQAGEHQAHRRRHGEGARLRPREGHVVGRGRGARDPDDCRSGQPGRSGGRNAGVHEPGASQRSAYRCPQRCVGLRVRVVRNAHGTSDVRRNNHLRDVGRNSGEPARLGPPARAGTSRRASCVAPVPPA